MDTAHPTTGLAQEKAFERVKEGFVPTATRLAVWEQNKREMFSMIIEHASLPSTMQLMVNAFVDLCPSKAMAIFLLCGDHFNLEAEAGLPQRPPVAALPAPQGIENLPRSNPVLRQILETGVKLCLVRPLLSGSGEAKGAVTVFDSQQGLLDDTTRESVLTLCDFARMAIEHRQLYDQVVGGSDFDALTGLPNRLALVDRLRQSLTTAQKQGTMVAICLIDLDRFRQINDSWGHELGDACFRAVSDRLQSSLREGDTLGRYGSDEFVITLCDFAQVSDAANICHRLLSELRSPLLVDEHRLDVSAGIGISIFPQDGDTPEALLRNAHIAMQKSKHPGEERVRVYSPALGRGEPAGGGDGGRPGQRSRPAPVAPRLPTDLHAGQRDYGF